MKMNDSVAYFKICRERETDREKNRLMCKIFRFCQPLILVDVLRFFVDGLTSVQSIGEHFVSYGISIIKGQIWSVHFNRNWRTSIDLIHSLTYTRAQIIFSTFCAVISWANHVIFSLKFFANLSIPLVVSPSPTSQYLFLSIFATFATLATKRHTPILSYTVF